MEIRQLVEELVTGANANARVIEMIEDDDVYRVRIAGTTGVVARCEIPREAMEEAAARGDARSRLGAMLKRCADETVAPVPDGRA
jgi:hypothetical protein